MNLNVRWGLSILLLGLIIAQPALAFDDPLSPEAIREAYFLGKGDANRRADFFGKYTKQYPAPKSGRHVGVIQFETPYVVIAERISQNVSNYFAQDAEQEYLGKPAICRVRVQVFYGYGISQPRPGEINSSLRTDYTVRLKQHDKEISSKTSSSEPLISSGSAPADIGLEFDIEYDAEKIDSAAPAMVEVLVPDGQDILQTFDLSTLR
jgi:hypothetical protein